MIEKLDDEIGKNNQGAQLTTIDIPSHTFVLKINELIEAIGVFAEGFVDMDKRITEIENTYIKQAIYNVGPAAENTNSTEPTKVQDPIKVEPLFEAPKVEEEKHEISDETQNVTGKEVDNATSESTTKTEEVSQSSSQESIIGQAQDN